MLVKNLARVELRELLGTELFRRCRRSTTVCQAFEWCRLPPVGIHQRRGKKRANWRTETQLSRIPYLYRAAPAEQALDPNQKIRAGELRLVQQCKPSSANETLVRTLRRWEVRGISNTLGQ